MADAWARVRGQLGVAITSTGTAAGNAAGAMVEAQTAGTPLLHLTGQIERPYLDRRWSYIHEATDQPGMLKARSEEHTSELQSLMRHSYAVFCLKTKTHIN